MSTEEKLAPRFGSCHDDAAVQAAGGKLHSLRGRLTELQRTIQQAREGAGLDGDGKIKAALLRGDTVSSPELEVHKLHAMAKAVEQEIVLAQEAYRLEFVAGSRRLVEKARPEIGEIFRDIESAARELQLHIGRADEAVEQLRRGACEPQSLPRIWGLTRAPGWANLSPSIGWLMGQLTPTAKELARETQTNG